jgi:tetratricopeptide (TPR) repeat protein
MRWYAGLAGVLLAARAGGQEPDYEAMFALRSSAGFRSALATADVRLSANDEDGAAAGVRALVYANAVDYLAMDPAEARERKLAALASALQLAPAGPWTRAAYGLIHLADDAAGAERELSTCIAEHPEFIECYNLYGDHLRKTGRTEKAQNVYREAMRRWPNDGELLVSYALLLQETREAARALDLLQELTRRQPRFARGHWHLAVMLYETGGDRSLAVREAMLALELDPLIWNGTRFMEMLSDVPGC